MDIFDFQCRCNKFQCEIAYPNPRLVNLIHRIEMRYGEEIVITSGKRCKSHNEDIGGHKNSRHCSGTAVDCYIPNIPHNDLYNWLSSTNHILGLGLYDTHVHIDIRHTPARWDNRTEKVNAELRTSQ